jgi:CTP:molybdopterin cytidylyltransferase MocA
VGASTATVNGALTVLAVLAGVSPGRAGVWGRAGKALLRVGGRTSLERVLEAAGRSRAFGRILVVGPPELDEAIGAADVTTPVRRLEQGESFVDNIRRAFAAAALDPAERLIIVPGDMPLVAPHELAQFAALVERSPADVCVALARPMRSAAHRSLVPHYRRSMLIAKGGPYLTGNLFALRERVLDFDAVLGWARRLRHQSRSANIAWALARLAFISPVGGFVLLLRLAIARALWLRRADYESIPAIAPDPDAIPREAAKLVDHRASVEFVDVGADGACYDIDDAEQYEAIEAMLRTAGCRGRVSPCGNDS